MEVRKVRAEMQMGRSIFDLPLRVTFYARVSTEKYEQLNSLENQVQYYTDFIQSQPNWAYIEGYVDEGISGTSTRKRDSFNRMIADGEAGRFDFIITKEISRFSRNTLDSIRYTQELLEHNVGVLFQNDNINTLDPDSEFRLVVMAGVAQDEMRKLSERLKFGFRQSIKNGRVLGNDKIWGYDKKGCRLTVNEAEAEAVRQIFDLYANEGLGIRRLSQKLLEMGYTSRKGNAFNVLTIRHILQNPKYKGWYCGKKTESLDYRSKKKVFLDPDEWTTYPDPDVPAIVSEELWDRANSLYRTRSAEMKAHQSAAGFHNRYPYSGKLLCEEHGTGFHRQLLTSGKGEKEVWQCRVYREKGRAGCSAPQLRTEELNEVMARIFSVLALDKQTVIETLVALIRRAPGEDGCGRGIERLEQEKARLGAKKDRLLELSLQGALSTAEFKSRNDEFNEQMWALAGKCAALRGEQQKAADTAKNLAQIRDALRRELDFADGIDPELVTTILDRIVVKKDSTKTDIHLEVHLKFGAPRDVLLARNASSFRLLRF